MKKCLIVDDSRVLHTVTRSMLEGLIYRVNEAGDGYEALDICQADMPDIVLVDRNMPGMNGLQFMAALDQIAPTDRPKVVFCSAEIGANHVIEAIERGADDFIMKPFDRPTLERKLGALHAS